MVGPQPHRPLVLFAALFFASGAAALVVETSWMRSFRVLFGATAPAVSATLTAFLVGQAAGAWLASRALPRIARPLRFYGWLELAAAGWSLAVPWLLALFELAAGAVYDAWRDSPPALAALRFAIALAATLPASLCFGATFPAIAAAALPGPASIGTRGAGLYASNLTGAAFGTAVASFWLPEWIGVPWTLGFGVALGAGAGLAALGSATGVRAGAARADPVRPRAAVSPEPSAPVRGAAPLALAAASGFGTFAAQVLCVQAFALVLNQSVYAFGAVLVTVLASLGAAALAVSRLAARLHPNTLLGGAFGFASIAFLLFPAGFEAATGIGYVGSGGAGYLATALGTALCVAGPALFAAGCVFPALLASAGAGAPSEHARPTTPGRRDATRNPGKAPRSSAPGAAGEAPGGAGTEAGIRIGRLAAANTAGALAGTLAAPYALLPALGLWPSFLALAALYAGCAATIRGAAPRERAARTAVILVCLAAGLLAASPLAVPLSREAPGERLLHRETRADGVVSVVERAGERLIRTDNHYSLGGTAERVHQEREGHLPLLLYPNARRVVFVGSATGISAGAATAHSVEKISLVEIVPGVAHAAGTWFGHANRGVQRDPRTEVVLDDARNFLRATRERFDLVVADLFVPWRSGAGGLYTREHFAAVRARLRDDGVFCQWLPLYQLTERELRVVIATFLDVFPRAAMFRGDFYGRFPIVALVGYSGRAAPPSAVSAAAVRLAEDGERDRWMTDPLGPWALYVGPLSPLAGPLAGFPRNTDAHPRIEYLAAQSHAGGAAGKREPIVGMRFVAFSDAIRRAAGERDPLFPGLSRAERDASRGGGLLQMASALYVSGRNEEAGRALAAAAALLPPHLLADAPPDATAADVWVD